MILIEECLEAIQAGVMRVDFESGMVHQTFATSLYTYERPVGILRRDGYVAISLGYRRQVLAHRLIWAAAHGMVDPDLQINHKNGVKHDNRLRNLEQVTGRENVAHAHRTGLVKAGDANPKRKLLVADVAEVRRLLAAGERVSEIAARFGVSPALIQQVRHGDGRFAHA